MALHRRHLLTALGTTGVATLAGCPSIGSNELSEQTTKLAAADGDESDYFGGSVAVTADGTTALLSAPGSVAPKGEFAGRAYVFERTGGSWTQQAKFTPTNGDGGDQFGESVAVAADGSTALVGVPGSEDPNGEGAGSAYVFERAGNSWRQQTKLTAADGDEDDNFGSSVAVAADGTTALVGAPDDEDPNGEEAGAAYLFERSGGSWTQQAKLAPTNGNPHDEFGDSVAVAANGTTALLVAPHGGDPHAGAAYVFERSGGSWTQQLKLTPANGDSQDEFGVSVAMAADGTTALIGALEDEDPNGYDAGVAYVFEQAGGTWTQQAKLAAADGDSKDRFGDAVAMAADGTTALVGASLNEDPNGKRAGAAYVFERAGGTWTQQANLAPTDGDPGDRFGASVAMAADGSTALVGAPEDEAPNGETGGSAYVFERAGGSWTQQAKLAPADGDAGDGFGDAVAMAADGSTALVGTPDDEDPNGEGAGAAYVFERSGGSWYQ